MKVYVALIQPDGDWDHIATLLGVYEDKEVAEKRVAPYNEPGPRSFQTGHVFECTLNVDVDFR